MSPHFENIDKNTYIQIYSNCRSCVSLISTKEVLASYEEFRSHLSNNIVKHSWNEDFDEVSASCQDRASEKSKDLSQLEGEEESTSNGVTSSDIKIQSSWSEAGVERKGSTSRGTRSKAVDKPFSCTHCDYSCAQSSNMKKHMRMHTGEKPCRCTQCDYFCTQSSGFKRHMRVAFWWKTLCCSPRT